MKFKASLSKPNDLDCTFKLTLLPRHHQPNLQNTLLLKPIVCPSLLFPVDCMTRCSLMILASIFDTLVICSCTMLRHCSITRLSLAIDSCNILSLGLLFVQSILG